MPEHAPLQRLLEQLIDRAPTVGAAIITLVFGLMLAWALGHLVTWLMRRLHLDAALEHLGASRVLYGMGLRQGVDRVGGRLVTGIGALLTFAATADVLGLTVVTDGIEALVAFVPQLLAATGILVAGLVAADMLRRVARKLADERDDLAAPDLAGDLVYYAVLAITLTLSADQVGLDIALVHHLILLVLGTALLGFALSFALGGRHSFRDLVARHHAERLYRPGDHLRVGPHEGVLVRFDAVTATLRGPDGDVMLPARMLIEDAVYVDPLPDQD